MDRSHRETEDETINSREDLEVSDVFKINPYEFFIITEISNDTASGIVRDGIYTVGDQHDAEFTLQTIMDHINEDYWTYRGPFIYDGEDINGDKI